MNYSYLAPLGTFEAQQIAKFIGGFVHVTTNSSEERIDAVLPRIK